MAAITTTDAPNDAPTDVIEACRARAQAAREALEATRASNVVESAAGARGSSHIGPTSQYPRIMPARAHTTVCAAAIAPGPLAAPTVQIP